jgi:TetR/AcrR family transcriptional regulator, fatty acid metabolism regulator protein
MDADASDEIPMSLNNLQYVLSRNMSDIDFWAIILGNNSTCDQQRVLMRFKEDFCMDSKMISENSNQRNKKSGPPGRTKIMEALKSLLEEKEFVSITIAEIARTAGVTEALIYKYFQDKRDLLHQVLAEYLDFFFSAAQADLRGVKGALNKLRRLIKSHINMYMENRVFARILLVEVRNYPDYFNSDAYQLVKRYSDFIIGLVTDGMNEGSIRKDIPAHAIRQAILGGIEHVCLPGVIFNSTIDIEEQSEYLSEIIFNGIAVEQIHHSDAQ